MDLYAWMREVLADREWTRLKRFLRDRSIPPDVRVSTEAYLDADAALSRYLAWANANSRTRSAERDCGDMPIMTSRHPDRWKYGSRDRQFAELREIIEAMGCPLKRELMDEGFQEREISARFAFALKLTADGEALDIEAGTPGFDYDPAEARRVADEYNAGRPGFDRMLSWDYVFTLCGRTHGYFEADESRRFEDAWRQKYGSLPPQTPWLLLQRITLNLRAVPAEERYVPTTAS